MILPFEHLLVLGAIGIYLIDAAMLLYANQMVIIRRSKDWAFALPSSRWEVMRKQPYLPNPFTPHCAIFLATWVGSTRQAGGQDQPRLLDLIACLRPIRLAALSLLALLLVGGPIALLLLRTHAAFLVLLALMYLNIIFMLTMVYMRKQRLGLSGKDFAKLAFDGLACAPLAINLARKISLRHEFAGDPIEFAKENGNADTVRSLSRELTARVDEMLEAADDGNAKSDLEQFRQRLLKAMT